MMADTTQTSFVGENFYPVSIQQVSEAIDSLKPALCPYDVIHPDI